MSNHRGDILYTVVWSYRPVLLESFVVVVVVVVACCQGGMKNPVLR